MSVAVLTVVTQAVDAVLSQNGIFVTLISVVQRHQDQVAVVTKVTVIIIMSTNIKSVQWQTHAGRELLIFILVFVLIQGVVKEEGTFWDKSFNIEISNIPLGTIIYSPVNTPPGEYTFFPYNLKSRKDYYNFGFGIDLPAQGELARGMEKISTGGIGIGAIGIKLLPEGIENKMVYDLAPFPLYSLDINMGIPIAQIINKEYLDERYWDEEETPIDPSNEPSISMGYGFSQLKNPDMYLETGLENLLTLGKEELPVFILPAYE